MAEPKKLTEDEAIQSLNKIINNLSKEAGATAATGACIYNAGGKTYCASMSKEACNVLSGIWTEGGKCQ